MMWNTINRVASAHKGIARAGGFLMGYLAASPLKHPFMALAALATGGEYLKRKREAEATDAARQAAVASYRDCHDTPEKCEADAKAAAVQAGLDAMHGDRRTLPVPLAILLAFAVFVGMLVIFKING